MGGVLNSSHLAGPYAWNYGDFLMTGGAGCNNFRPGEHCPGQTDSEYRTQFSVYVIAASPLIIGTDIRNMTPIMKSAFLNTELLAINQDYQAPAGDLVGSLACSTRKSSLVSTTTAADDAASVSSSSSCGPFITRMQRMADSNAVAGHNILVWARHNSDDSVALGVTNIDDVAHNVDVPLTILGFDARTTIKVRDVWRQMDRASVTGSINVVLGHHDTAVFRLSK